MPLRSGTHGGLDRLCYVYVLTQLVFRTHQASLEP